jgi:hypothetical protein
VHHCVLRGGSRIARRGKCTHQLEGNRGVVRRARRQPATVGEHARVIALLLALRRHCFKHRNESVAESLAFAIHPALEVRGVGDVQGFEKVPAIQLERLVHARLADCVVERDRVAPDQRRRNAQRVAAVADDDVIAEGAPEEVHCLTQCVARLLGGLIRPEEREQLVTRMRPTGRREREVGEQGCPLRLCEDLPKLFTIVVPEVEHPKSAQMDHVRLLKGSAHREVRPGKSRIRASPYRGERTAGVGKRNQGGGFCRPEEGSQAVSYGRSHGRAPQGRSCVTKVSR